MVAITMLLPLTAGMVVAQVNPYHALVIRGILGAVAALVYALFGAADVALTEALVGTMLSITLYAIAVRSSMSMRLGVLDPPSEPLLSDLQKALRKHHLRVELVPYDNLHALQTALTTKQIHTVLSTPVPPGSPASSYPLASPHTVSLEKQQEYHIQTRVQRLYEVMQAELSPHLFVKLAYVSATSPSKVDRTEIFDQKEQQA
ncbi:MAG: DUF4040 domain-containing protein [Cyanobacteria bacterium P01_D01_bin.44]